MPKKQNLFIIVGSAARQSANLQLVECFARLAAGQFELTIFTDLKTLPHFDPDLSADNPPETIIRFRKEIEKADGIIICTPEYVFSIPSGLKNAIEWCVSTTVFSGKPTGLITASANGQKGHEELKLIMNTVMARFTGETTLLIHGIKGKINEEGEITDSRTKEALAVFSTAFSRLVKMPVDENA